MAYVQDSLTSDAVLLGALAEASRELAEASSVEEVAEIVGRFGRRHFLIDSIGLHLSVPSCVEYWPERRETDTFQTSIQLPVNDAGPLASVSGYWRQPRAISAPEQAVLEVVAQTASLALKILLNRAKGGPPAGQYVARERGRFFEFQRQVRGLLAVVRSIVRRTVDVPYSKEEYAAHLEGRLDAIARIQGFLLRAPEAKEDLEELGRAEFLAQAISDDRAHISGPRILLSGKAAETLGLAFHELATNAIKFGSLNRPEGSVRIFWDRQPKDRTSVQLEWREQVEAAGLTATAVEADAINKGFGFELIEKVLPYELGAKSSLAISSAGAHCAITFTAGLESSRPRGQSPPL